MSAGSPVVTRRSVAVPEESEADAEDEEDRPASPPKRKEDSDVAEVVFFEYGVAVFFGLGEEQEKGILEDLDNAGILKRAIKEDDWEVEECYFVVRFRDTVDSGDLLLKFGLYSMTRIFYILVYITISSVSFSLHLVYV
jgi:uncharacterized Rmd1/YagE family protein